MVTWTKYLFLGSMLLLYSISIQAQVWPEQGEYYIDIDNGVGTGIPFIITDDGSPSQDLSIPVASLGLEAGLHSLYMRVKDQTTGDWSLSKRLLFNIYDDSQADIISSTHGLIYAAEYYVDNDPGVGNGMSIEGISAEESIAHIFTFVADTFAVGTHTLYLRVKDVAGNWSHAASYDFDVTEAPSCTFPTPLFSSDIVQFGQTTTFQNLSTDVDAGATYEWDVDVDSVIDGTSLNFSHVFSSPGYHSVSLKVINDSICASNYVGTIAVGTFPSETLSLSGSTELCTGDSLTITAEAGNEYLWNNGDTTSAITVTEAGEYYCKLISADGLCLFSETISVTTVMTPSVTSSIGNETNSMANGSIQVVPDIPGTLITDYTYLWSTGSSDYSISGLSAGDYSVTITADGSCPIVLNFTVNNIAVSEGLMAAEYYLDSDPGVGNGIPLAITEGDVIDQTMEVSIDGLSPGQHCLSIRVKDFEGRWSVTGCYLFAVTDTVPPTPTVGADLDYVEYYIDEDPGFGNGEEIAYDMNDPYSGSAPIDVTGLETGQHTVHVRTKDTEGNWSFDLDMLFHVIDTVPVTPPVTLDILTDAEYFIDQDPGVGNGVALADFVFGDSYTGSFAVDIDSLTVGTHGIYVRVKDQTGLWSISDSVSFSVLPEPPCEQPVASFGFNENVAVNSLEIFSNSSINTFPTTTYAWDVGADGSVEGTSEDFSYTFTDPGFYQIALTVTNSEECFDTEIVLVAAGTLPSDQLTASGDLSICLGDSVQLTAPVAAEYFWNTGEMSQSIWIKDAGSYFCFITNDQSLSVFSDTLTLVTLQVPTFEFLVTNESNGDSNGSIVANPVLGNLTSDFDYSWSTGSTDYFINGISAGPYSLQASNENCVVDFDFTISNSNISSGVLAAEYFFDLDPGIGNAISLPIASGADVTGLAELDISSLDPGPHTLYLRFEDESGNWSLALPRTFHVIDTSPPVLYEGPDITAAEYFIDNDPGPGAGIPLDSFPTSPSHEGFLDLDVSSLSIGDHTAHFRYMDADGNWSLSKGYTFNIDPDLSLQAIGVIDGVFLGTDSLTGLDIVDEMAGANLQFRLKNIGTVTLDSININYQINGAATNTISWTGSLIPQDNELVELPIIPQIEQHYEYLIWTSENNGATDLEGLNDSLRTTLMLNPANDHYSIDLTGQTDYVEIPNDSILNISTPEVTIEAWVFATSGDDNSARLIVKQVENNSNPNIAYGLYEYSNTSRITCRIAYENNQYTDLRLQTNLPQNEWVHVAFSFSGSAGTFDGYYNGILQPADLINPILDAPLKQTSTPLTLGADLEINADGSAENFNGRFDEVRVWNVARTQAQIKEWMPKVTGVESEIGLVGVWHFGESSGNIAFETLNGLDGNLNNGAYFSLSEAPILDTEPVDFFDFSLNEISVAGDPGDLIIIDQGVVQPVDISFTNLSNVSLTTATFDWALNNESGQALWNGGLDPGETTTLSINVPIDLLPIELLDTISVDLVSLNDSSIVNMDLLSSSIEAVLAINPSDTHYALFFDGGSRWVNATVPNLPQGEDPVTIEAWINPRDLDATILSWGTSGNHRFQINNGKLLQTLFVSGGNSDHFEESTGSILGNEWTHVAMSFDGDSVRFYINGILDHTAFMSSGTTATVFEELNIGRMLEVNSSESFFDGQIDEVRIWNDARTGMEIREWMTKSDGITSEDGLVNAWHFAEGSGGLTFEALNNIQGVFNNTPVFISSGAPVEDPEIVPAIDAKAESISASGNTNTGLIIINEADNPVSLGITISNQGNTPLTSAYIDVEQNGVSVYSGNNTFPAITQGGSSTIDLGNNFTFLPETTYDLSVVISNPNGVIDTDPSNNTIVETAVVNPSITHFGIALDGSGDYVDLPDEDFASNLDEDDTFTIEGWVESNSTSRSEYVLAVNSSTGGNVLLLGFDTSPNSFIVFDGTSQAVVPRSEMLGRHHFAYVRNGATADVFIDGELKMTHTPNYTLSADDQWSVGMELDGTSPSQFLLGNVDDIRIWNEPRSGSQIKEWMAKNTNLTAEPGLVAYWPFAEGSGTSAFDAVDFAEATLVGQAAFYVTDFPIADSPPAIDLGIIAVLDPISGCDKTNSEAVTLRIRNFGTDDINTFDLGFIQNNGTPYLENFNSTISSGSTVEITLSATANLVVSSLNEFDFFVSTALDEYSNNDTLSTATTTLPSVNITLTDDVTIDYGDELTLIASGGTNYTWQGELEGEDPYSPSLLVAPFFTQTYIVTVTNDQGCSATDSVVVTVNPIPDLPDLEVSNVVSGVTDVSPGDLIPISWDVNNVGTSYALIDWTEKIYVESTTGANRTIIANVIQNGDTLDVGETIPRTYDALLPDVLSIGDSGVFVVEIIPSENVLEPPFSTANNTGIESPGWKIDRQLDLSLTSDQITEGGSGVYCSVSRSGGTSSSLLVTLTSSDPARFSFPATLTIPAGQSAKTFYIYAVENSDLEGPMSIGFTVSADGFSSDIELIELIDDEIPALSISGLPISIPEGDSLSFTVSTDFPSSDTLFINLISSEPSDVLLPTPVMILPDSSSVLVELILSDDDIAEPDETIEITAGSAGFTPAFGSFILTNDNDIPTITFELITDTVAESAGLYATQGKITRLGETTSILGVNMSSSDPASLYMPSTVPLGPGEMEKTFYIGVFDNAFVDGFRDIEITASVLLASCNCNAAPSSGGVFSDTLTIADNDGPSLTLMVNPLSMPENLANAGTLTVQRNTPTDVELIVSLSFSDSTELSLPPSVTIPIGQASIGVPITTLGDTLIDGNQQVDIQATAPGFSPGLIWAIVTDINKPDFQIPEVTVSSQTVPALDQFQFHAFVTNQGVANAPGGAIVKGYLSLNTIVDANDHVIGEYIIESPILVGDTFDLWDIGTAPYNPGNYNLIFEVNGNQALSELIYINNTSTPKGMEILPDYLGSAIVDDTAFYQGTSIPIYGSSFKAGGDVKPNAELEVYILNGGLRREILVTTDALGNYSTQFNPLPNEADHYIVGASFPGLESSEEQDDFDIMGVKINNGNYIVWEFLLGDTLNGQLSVENLSEVPITNLTLEAIPLESGGLITFDTIPQLLGNETLAFNYTVSGTVVNPVGFYQQIPLQFRSDEEVNSNLTAYYFCQAQSGYLSSSISSINRTISQTQSNVLEFKIFNNGEGLTGDVTISLPQQDFMSLISLDVIPSMESGDTSVVILEFSPSPSLPLNTPAQGTIVINAENGNFITIPYTVEKVSEETGGVLVDVIDQYTYFTDEAPHVDSAFVKISHYFTGEIFAQGYTDSLGLFLAEDLPEGLLRIQVQAVQHTGYDNTINILPGTNITETIFLEYQAISFTWDVVPTTIEDTYLIDLIMEFETNVPVPVVTIEVPDTMPQLFGDETFSFFATLTNHGLITARDVELILPQDHPDFEFITNYTPTDLGAQQAIQVPVTMRLRETAAQGPSSTYNNLVGISEFLGMGASQSNSVSSLTTICTDFVLTVYWYECGGNGLWQQGGELFTYAGTSCVSTGTGNGNGITPNFGPYGGFNPCPGCPGPGPTGPYTGTPGVPSNFDCNDFNCLLDILGAAGGCYPPTAGAAGAIGCGAAIATSGWGVGIGKCVVGAITGCPGGIVQAGISCFGPLFGGPADNSQGMFNDDPPPPIIQQALEDMTQVNYGYEARVNWMSEYIGALIYNENLELIADNFAPYFQAEIPIESADSTLIRNSLNGFDVSGSEIDALIARWNLTLEAWNDSVFSPNPTYPGIMDRILIDQYAADESAAVDYANNRGYATLEEMHTASTNAIIGYFDGDQQGVCASVTIQISQELTMTREAFEGTLTVNNGHPTDAIQSLELDLQILDPNGVLSNDLFQIEVISLNTLTAIDGTGTLPSQQEGSAVVLFIPEPGAAPTVPITYSFGGTISYLDPFSDLIVTLPLIPSILQVNPSPDLYLHYFMQRDIYGDDPLTQAIEPILPGELAVMIENNGYGVGMGVMIESSQPEIVDNEDGLAIEFSLIGSNLQGEPAALGLTNINFGNIAPLSTKIGQWYFTSTLLGHFINYETNLVHLDSYGNPDLSLISGVELHELIHSISVYGADDGIDDFLVNEIQDLNETPDAIYLSQGNLIYDVLEAESAHFTGNILAPGNTTQFHIDPLALGWNYIKIDDPGNGNFEILSVTRNSDGQVLPLKNTWLSHVTLPDSQEPIYEDKFHFVDDFNEFTEETYTVVWSPKDPNPPFVVDILGAPSTVSSEQVTNLIVEFSEDIIDSTFTTEDLMLNFQGGPNIMDETVIITELDSVTYDIDLSTLTTGNGFYNFTAQAAGIQDLTGTNGEVGQQATWTQFLSVPSVVEFSGLPENNIGNEFDTVRVLFNMPIDVSTLTVDRFSILFDGIEQTGALTIEQLNVEKTLFELTGLGSFLGSDGDYELAVDLLNIMSEEGQLGLAVQSIDLTLDTQAPSLINLLRFIGSGLDAQHYTGVTMNFDEDVVLFDTSAVQLWRDGVLIYPEEAVVSQVNPSWFEIESFEQLTYPDGQYSFRVLMDSITDLAGNPGSGVEQTNWSVNRTPSLVISGLAIEPDMGFSTTDGVTATTDLDINFGINDSSLTISIYQNDNGVLSLIQQLDSVPPGAVQVSTVFETGGNTAIYIEAIDMFGNQVTASKSLYIDESPLSAVWDFEAGQSLSAHPVELDIEFSHQLLDPSELVNVISATYNNTVINASGLSLQSNSITSYTLLGLSSLNDAPGTYSIGIDLTQLNKYTSGIAGSSISYVTWSINDEGNSAPIADAGSDTLLVQQTTYQLDGTDSFDPDGDPLEYTWYPPDGITLSDVNSPSPSFSATSADNGSYEFLLSVSDGLAFSTDVVQIEISIVGASLLCPPAAIISDIDELLSSDLGSPVFSTSCDSSLISFVDSIPSDSCSSPIIRTYTLTDTCGTQLSCTQEITLECDCQVFETPPVDLRHQYRVIQGMTGLDRVTVKWYKDSPFVKYSVQDSAACDIEFWPVRAIDPNTGMSIGPVIQDPDTSLIPQELVRKVNKPLFKWPLMFTRQDIDPNFRYKWRVRCYCQLGQGDVTPWSEVKSFITPDFDPESGMFGSIEDITASKLLDNDIRVGIIPNPNDGTQFRIKIDSGEKEYMRSIRIYTMDGLLVLQENTIGESKEHIVTGGFRPGMYLVHIETDDSILIEHLIVH